MSHLLVIYPRADVEIAILAAVPLRGRPVEATALYVGLNRAMPSLSYGAF